MNGKNFCKMVLSAALYLPVGIVACSQDNSGKSQTTRESPASQNADNGSQTGPDAPSVSVNPPEGWTASQLQGVVGVCLKKASEQKRFDFSPQEMQSYCACASQATAEGHTFNQLRK